MYSYIIVIWKKNVKKLETGEVDWRFYTEINNIASTYFVGYAIPTTKAGCSIICHYVKRSHRAGTSTLQSVEVAKPRIGDHSRNP